MHQASTSAPLPTATEKVTRPEPGLARGMWEASEAAFWVALVVVVLASSAYLLHRLGILKLKKERSSDGAPRGHKTP